jgi:hypothetical protein
MIPSIRASVTVAVRTLTRKIAEGKNLEGVAPGDRIEITYTLGVVVAAESSKE